MHGWGNMLKSEIKMSWKSWEIENFDVNIIEFRRLGIQISLRWVGFVPQVIVVFWLGLLQLEYLLGMMLWMIIGVDMLLTESALGTAGYAINKPSDSAYQARATSGWSCAHFTDRKNVWSADAFSVRAKSQHQSLNGTTVGPSERQWNQQRGLSITERITQCPVSRWIFPIKHRCTVATKLLFDFQCNDEMANCTWKKGTGLIDKSRTSEDFYNANSPLTLNQKNTWKYESISLCIGVMSCTDSLKTNGPSLEAGVPFISLYINK